MPNSDQRSSRPRTAALGLALVAIFYGGVTAASAEKFQTDAPKPDKSSNVSVAEWAGGLEHPWAIAFLPDGRALVTERPGRLRLIAGDGKTMSPPIEGVPKVWARRQGGLLDVALARDFETSGEIYLSYSEPVGAGKSRTAVARARLALDTSGSLSGKLENLEVIFRQTPAVNSGFHFGSRIVVAPDNSLFVTTGDRGSKRQAQNPDSTIGVVARILRDGTPHPDNPRLEGWRPEIYSIGHRNIQGAAYDDGTGTLWTVEHGARGGDELNRPQSGKNYGWPIITHGVDYSGAEIGIGSAREGLEQPVYYWVPSIAVSGLERYSGKLFADWKGNLLVGGLAGAQIARLVVDDGGRVTAEEALISNRGDRIRDVVEGPDGAIYAAVDEVLGAIIKLTPAATN